MSVTVNLTNGKYSLNFEAGVKATDTAKPVAITEAFILGQGTIPVVSATLSDGTGANKANKAWAGVLTIGASSSTTLVLSDGSLIQAGQAMAFTKIRRLLVRFRSPAAGKKVTIGNAASHPWPWAPGLSAATATRDVGSVLLSEEDVDGWAVGSGSADQLKIANPGGTSVTVDVVLIGE